MSSGCPRLTTSSLISSLDAQSIALPAIRAWKGECVHFCRWGDGGGGGGGGRRGMPSLKIHMMVEARQSAKVSHIILARIAEEFWTVNLHT